MAATPPPEKKPRLEEAEELEKDAPPASGACNKTPVVFHVPDTTMNILPSAQNLLKSLGDSGVQHLYAGARASVGMKAGRHMFEAKLVEFQDYKGRSLCRLGVSTSEAPLLIGEDSASFCFDGDGSVLHAKKRVATVPKFTAGATYAVVVNLEKGSPNCDTISLFRDGVRICAPQALPDSLKGKTLYPAVTFKASTVHLHFGPSPLAPLPFACRTLVGAAKADVEVRPAPEAKTHSVVYPVGLPGEGVFDWCDMFLKRNPGYTEISDRAVVAWALASGLQRRQGGRDSSKDESWSQFGIHGLDNGDARHALLRIAPVQQRDYVIMELKGNLLKDDRKLRLDRFPSALFQNVAHVVVGEPTADFKTYTTSLVLKDKQAASDAAFKMEKIKAKRQKELEKMEKAKEKAKKKAELAKKKAEEKAKEAAEKKEADGEEAKAEDAEEKAKEKDENVKEDDVEEDEEMPEQEEQEEEPPKVSLGDLTEEQKAIKFHVTSVPDMAASTFNTSFTKFSLPDKSEGFHDVIFAWSKAGPSATYLKEFVLSRKLTTRIEDTNPSTAFKTQLNKWQQEFKAFKNQQQNYKSAKAKKEAEKKAKALKKEAAAKAAESKKEEESKKEDEEKKDEVEEEKQEMEVEEDDEVEEADFDNVDIFAVDDVCDIGGGMPLFRDFLPEDWAMMSLRFELYLLCHHIRIDAADPERTGIYLEHLEYYYSKYLNKKKLISKDYGVSSVPELVALIPDTVHLSKDKVLQTLLPEELEKFGIFVRLTEEARRHRTLIVDAGDETARLKISEYAGSNNKKWDNNSGGSGNWKNYESAKTYDGSKGGYYDGGKGYDAGKAGKRWGGDKGHDGSKGGYNDGGKAYDAGKGGNRLGGDKAQDGSKGYNKWDDNKAGGGKAAAGGKAGGKWEDHRACGGKGVVPVGKVGGDGAKGGNGKWAGGKNGTKPASGPYGKSWGK